MSEYQYYEFLAIDRSLDESDRRALRALSSRAHITARSFSNHYEWGDFKGHPEKLMDRWFDLHLYLANWGTRRLMLRLPERLLDQTRLKTILHNIDWVAAWTSGENLIVDIHRDGEGPEQDWDDGSGWLDKLAPLRADVLSGDLRLFYLLWLGTVQDELVPDKDVEPLSGLGPLNEALQAFADFFRIDSDLVAAAAEHCFDRDEAALLGGAMRKTLVAMPEREKTELLLRLVAGDPHVAAELKHRIRVCCGEPSADPRTAGDLRARWTAIRDARERAEAGRREAERDLQAKEAEKARRARLTKLRQRGTRVWRDIEVEIGRRNASGYEAAAAFLSDLKDIAAERGTLADFAQRLAAILDRHASKSALIKRLSGLMPDVGRSVSRRER